MGNKMKKAAAVICVGAMALTSVPAAFAAEVPSNVQQQSEMAPRFSYIGNASLTFDITNRVATINSDVAGTRGEATKAQIEAVLQVKDGSRWSNVKKWTETQNDYRAKLYKTYSVDAGKTYRVVSTVKIWANGDSESHTLISEEETA